MESYKIVSCASFGSSGSGVITDYLLEFDNIFNPGDFEFTFLHDFGGITTLEDALVSNHHRQNSDTAIKMFKKYVSYHSGDIFNRRYEKYFQGKFMEITNNFLNQLIEVEWNGYWGEYQIFMPKWIATLKYKIYPRILRLLNGNKYHRARYVPRKPMYFTNPTSSYFTECVKKYLNDLYQVIDPQKKYNYLYFDQLLPSDNIQRYLKFFDDIHVIAVDRDPRDYYIENVLRYGEGWVPKDVDKYIIWYKNVRKKLIEEQPDEHILRIRFEDTVFKYDEFSQQINTFLNLKAADHVFPRYYFDPAQSINNTQLWKKYAIDPDVLKKIECKLGEYCYKF
jgi:hypothetical protein